MLNKKQLAVMKAIASGKNSVGKISQKTGMHRQSVRVILDSLVKENLVNKSGVSRIEYSIGNLDAARKSYADNMNRIESMIPALSAAYEETKDTQVMNCLTGKLGLRTVLLDEIIKAKTVRSFNYYPVSDDDAELYAENSRRRAAKKIQLFVLSPYPLPNIPISKIRKTNKKCNLSIFAYANKATMIFRDKEQILTIKIPEITEFFKETFDREWDSAPGQV